MKNLPKGKGLYVWNVESMPLDWDTEFAGMGISWIAVKIANGVNSSNLRRLDCGGTEDDILEPFIAAARRAGMMVLGWQYVYGFNPIDEADKADDRIIKFELDGFIIDAEHQYKGRHLQAGQYSTRLRALVPNIPVGLSTYRFPEGHPTLPYAEFLQICDFNAPQVYWNTGKAGQELAESYEQYLEIKELPFIPAGRSYYGEGFPEPTPLETFEFLDTAQKLGCPAAFFWSADALYHRVRPLPEIRKAIADYEWDVEGEEPEPESEPVSLPSVMKMNKLEIQYGNAIYKNSHAIWLSKKE